MTNPRRVLSKLRRSKAAVPATTGPAETPFQVGKVEDVNSTRQVVTFADVAGLDEAIAELREVKEFLSDPYRFQAVGAELPKGILLYGLPGCGKTLLARALAGEAGVPFYFVSATSFVEKFVGLGAARVRQLFEAAKRDAPSIIFIDELDAIGRFRSADAVGDREFDHTLNQLLVELDGFLGSNGVLVIGATNRPELIDSALLRPGRFDRRIQVDRPDRDGREKILMLHAARRPISRRVDWGEIATNTAGLSAAELANIVNESCLLAARRHRDRVAPEDVEEACQRVISGTRSAKLMTDEEKQLVAVHEAGHALLSILLRGVKPPARVSIVSRPGAFQRSPWFSADDREVLTKRELMAQLIVLLGGRAAEMNVFGQPSTRSEDDLENAASLARRMVERLAMTGRFELAGHGDDPKRPPPDDQHGGKEVRELLLRAEQAARTILQDNADDLQRIADELVERETLTVAELGNLTRRSGRPELDGESRGRLGVKA
jgi:cell division protease FtsH